MKRTLILTGEVARKAACREVLAAPEGYAVTIAERTRSLDQNALLWALLHELSVQTDWHGMKLSPDEWKDVFSAALKKQKVVPGLDGGFVVCGQRTSRMGKREFGDLLELVYAFGAERGVRFSDRAAA
jgi:hypothetical protein